MLFQTINLFGLLFAIVYFPGRSSTSPSTEDNNNYHFSLKQSLGADDTNGATITLEEWNRRFYERIFDGKWVSGNEILFRSINHKIELFNVDSLTKRILYEVSVRREPDPSGYELSADGKFLILQHDAYKMLGNRLSVSEYTIVDTETGKGRYINVNFERAMQTAIFAPVGNSFAFVFNYNVYYKKDPLEDYADRISDGGLAGKVHNGIPRWLYDDEDLTPEITLWFSPDGTKLAYLQIIEEEVSEMVYSVLGIPYPTVMSCHVPTAGRTTATLSLRLVDLENEYKQFLLFSPVELRDPILAKVVWANNHVINAIWINRVQNEMYILAYDVEELDTKTKTPRRVKVLHRFEGNGWFNFRFTNPLFSRDGSKFLFILSQEQNEIDGAFKHLVLIENEENGKVHVLTEGKFVVTQILGWDESEDSIYYQATTEKDPGSRHIYSITYPERKIKCMTCKLRSPKSNSNCLFNNAIFSRDYSHSIIDCKGPGIPSTFIFKGSKPIYIWEDNEMLAREIRSLRFPKVSIHEFSTFEDYKASALLLLPPNLDTTGETKYPLLVHVHGAPDYQLVTKELNLGLMTYLAANKDVIVVTIDGRGSDGKGDKNLFSIYRRFGTVDIEDQFNVIKQLQQKLPYVDPERIAVFGWSYGGYTAGMLLAHDKQGLFKCGISYAPITDWFTMQSVFTERYMGLPTSNDNIEGYKTANLLTKAEAIRGKKYLLVHGSFDNAVHIEQSMRLAKILQENDIPFSQLTYPDESHKFKFAKLHSQESIEMFLDDCFWGKQTVRTNIVRNFLPQSDTKGDVGM